MLGLSLDKIIVIAVTAAIIIGPVRVPLYAQKLAALVVSLSAFVDTANVRASQELGPDFDLAEWKRLDPRQYDPRRIVLDALADEVSSSSNEGVQSAAAPGWQSALLSRVGTRDKTDSPRPSGD